MTMIEEILAGLERAWNDGDGGAWGEMFSEDADFVDALGRVQQGRALIGQEARNLFETIYSDSRIRIRHLSTRPLGEGVVLAHTTSELEVPQGPRQGVMHSVQTLVIRDDRILAFQNTIRHELAEFAGQDETLAARTPLEWRHNEA